MTKHDFLVRYDGRLDDWARILWIHNTTITAKPTAAGAATATTTTRSVAFRPPIIYRIIITIHQYSWDLVLPNVIKGSGFSNAYNSRHRGNGTFID